MFTKYTLNKTAWTIYLHTCIRVLFCRHMVNSFKYTTNSDPAFQSSLQYMSNCNTTISNNSDHGKSRWIFPSHKHEFSNITICNNISVCSKSPLHPVPLLMMITQPHQHEWRPLLAPTTMYPMLAPRWNLTCDAQVKYDVSMRW